MSHQQQQTQESTCVWIPLKNPGEGRASALQKSPSLQWDAHLCHESLSLRDGMLGLSCHVKTSCKETNEGSDRTTIPLQHMMNGQYLEYHSSCACKMTWGGKRHFGSYPKSSASDSKIGPFILRRMTWRVWNANLYFFWRTMRRGCFWLQMVATSARGFRMSTLPLWNPRAQQPKNIPKTSQNNLPTFPDASESTALTETALACPMPSLRSLSLALDGM